MNVTKSLIAPASAFAIVILMGCGTVVLMFQIKAGRTQPFDESVIIALRLPDSHGGNPPAFWLDQVARNITSLGSITVVSIVTVLTAGFWLILRRNSHACLFSAMIVSGMAAYFAMKYVIRRTRPEIMSPLVAVHTPSLPSGHAMLAALLYLGLALRACQVAPSVRAKIYLVAMASLLTILVGFSRIVLAAHWPTDVLAGWMMGIGWVALWWLVQWTALAYKSRAVVDLKCPPGNSETKVEHKES